MILNASKTKTMIVSMSQTIHPKSTQLSLDGTKLEKYADLVIFEWCLMLMTFEKNLPSVFRAATQTLGILRKSWRVFHYRSLLLRSFGWFVMPVMEYCSALWWSPADSHLKLMDRAVSSASFLAGGVLKCNLAHRRSVAVYCMLFKIKSNPCIIWTVPLPRVSVRVTRGALVDHRHSFEPPLSRTSQHRITLFPTQYLCGTILWPRV